MCAGTPCGPCAEKARQTSRPLSGVQVIDRRRNASPQTLSGFLGIDWGGVARWVGGAASDVVEFAEDAAPYVEAGVAAYNQLTPSKQAQVDRRAAEIQEEFRRIGVVLTVEQSRALAQMPESQYRSELVRAQRQVAANGANSADGQTQGGYGPSTPTPPVIVQSPGLFAEVSPWMLAAGAALVFVVATKK